MSQPATQPLSIEAWTDSLDDTFLLCRDVGHTWRPFRAAIEDSYYWRVMRCGRCKTERVQYLTMSGHIASGHYVYPEGYLAPKGSGPMYGDARDHLRLESVLRTISKDEHRSLG